MPGMKPAAGEIAGSKAEISLKELGVGPGDR